MCRHDDKDMVVSSVAKRRNRLLNLSVNTFCVMRKTEDRHASYLVLWAACCDWLRPPNSNTNYISLQNVLFALKFSAHSLFSSKNAGINYNRKL